MKKILIVNDLLQGGGVEKLMYDMVWKFHDKYEITVMAYVYATLEEFHDIFPENVKFLPMRPKGEEDDKLYLLKQKGIRAISKIKMQADGFDLVIAMKDGWVMQIVHDLNIQRKLAWIHTDYKAYHYTKGLYSSDEEELDYMKAFERVVCVSKTIKESIIEVLGDPGNLEVLYNPIDKETIRQKAEEPVVDVPEKSKDIVRFVTVGRQNMQKGYELLLEASYILNKDKLPFEVYVVGGNEGWGESERIAATKKRLGVENVFFLGDRKNPYKYIKQADYFLSTSLFEGYSYVSQEAAVLGKAMLLTDCSGVRELLGDNEDYGMVMNISVFDIYQKMKYAIENPALIDEYHEKILKRVELFDEDKAWAEIEKIL